MILTLRKKYLLYLGCIVVALSAATIGYIYVDVPLRTQIYRSLFKGNWNLLADGDTVYATGYCGIRKYLIKRNEAELLAENESFLRNRMIGNGAAVKENYIFLACRSYLPGPVKNDKASYEGKLLVMNKSDLTILSDFSLPSKMNDAIVTDSILLLSGINRFILFKITDPQFPQKMSEHISSKYTEYQGATIWKNKEHRYAAFSLFTLGIDIWDITDCANPVFVKNINLSDICNGNKNVQSMAIMAHYPYLFATLAPTSSVYFEEDDIRGVIRVDISDIENIRAKAFVIPRKDYWKPMPGDSHPKSLDFHDDKIYLSAATSGAAVFKIEKNGELKYDGIKKISSSSNQIYPICITQSAYLVSGDWNWNKLHVKKLVP